MVRCQQIFLTILKSDPGGEREILRQEILLLHVAVHQFQAL